MKGAFNRAHLFPRKRQSLPLCSGEFADGLTWTEDVIGFLKA